MPIFVAYGPMAIWPKMAIWPYWAIWPSDHMQKKYGQVRYPWKELQKCSLAWVVKRAKLNFKKVFFWNTLIITVISFLHMVAMVRSVLSREFLDIMIGFLRFTFNLLQESALSGHLGSLKCQRKFS